MTATEIRNEINKHLDQLSEEELINVLNFVNNIKNVSISSTKSDKNIQKILTEDNELLRRLAE